MIAAVGKNGELGKNNNLIWHLKGDMQFFKNTTMNHVIVMGKNTFLSLPGLLKDRKHIVISHSNDFPLDVEVYKSIDEFLEKYKDFDGEIFIIGGAKIYNEFLKYSDKLYLTEIDSIDPSADVYFPYFDKNDYESDEIINNEENNIKYTIKVYRRLK